jgi:hypothetical protein
MTKKGKTFSFFRATALGLAVGMIGSTAHAFNEPPGNLSATTFLDGGAPPGLYYINYAIFVDGGKAVDKNGAVIPGGARVDVLSQVNQFYYLTDFDVLGGKLGLDFFVPLVAVTAQGTLGGVPVTANTAGLGDLLAGPALQWDKGTLLGRPVFQRVESDVSIPTGKYDSTKLANPGSNLWNVDTYYSFVWLFGDEWETSDRVWYGFNGVNPATEVQPGQRLIVDYAVSREVLPRFRLGAAGYFVRQTTDDKIAGVRQPDSRERVVGVGPGLVYRGQGLTFELSHPIEFLGENRFVGSRTTLELVFKF